MTEHVCCVCPQLRHGEPRIYERANVCEGHRAQLRSILAEIVELYVKLDPRKPTTGGQRVSGSRTPPLPFVVDTVDLRLPPNVRTVHDAAGDQVGEISIATRLESWARDWQTHDWATLPPPTVSGLARWLLIRVDDICDRHPAVDEFAADLRDQLRILRRVNGISGPAFDTLDIPCRRCDCLALIPVAKQDRVECLQCGDLASGEEYTRWTGLLTAGVRHRWVDFDPAVTLYVDEAALLVKVTADVIRQWTKRGTLPVADRDHGRPMFTAADVFEAERRTRSGVVLAQ